jgi:hypothetical protein
MSDKRTEISRENLSGTKMDGDKGSVNNLEDAQTLPRDQDAVKHLQNEFHIALRNWRRQMNEVRYKLVKERNTKSLELGSQALLRSMKEITEAQDVLEDTLDSTVEKMALFAKFEDISHETDLILKEVNSVLRELRSKEDCLSIASSKKSRRSSRSKSSCSSTSTTSTAQQRRMDLEEEHATLKAKLQMAEAREDLDEANRKALEHLDHKRLELKREESRVMKGIENATKKFEITQELAEREARINVCKRYEEELAPSHLEETIETITPQEQIARFLDSQPNVPNSTDPITEAIPPPPEDPQQAPPSPSLDPLKPAFIPKGQPPPPVNQPNPPHPPADNNVTHPSTEEYNVVQAQLQVISKLLEAQNQNRLPLPEPGTFTGDPLQFPIWLRAFETLVESRALNPAKRLHFLGKYVSGEVKELIKGFMLYWMAKMRIRRPGECCLNGSVIHSRLRQPFGRRLIRGCKYTLMTLWV